MNNTLGTTLGFPQREQSPTLKTALGLNKALVNTYTNHRD